MAKSVARNKDRIRRERIEAQSFLVNAAMKLGFTSKTDICTHTGLKIWELNNLFGENKELHSTFCVIRRTMVDTAADNLQDILNDKTHPQNFQATKYVLQTYKSDLDSQLEKQTANDLEVAIKPGDSRRAVRISFTSGEKK